MELVRKHQQMNRSLKLISPLTQTNKIVANPIRTSMDEKIELLKIPVYTKKKIPRRNMSAFSIQMDKSRQKLTRTHRRTQTGVHSGMNIIQCLQKQKNDQPTKNMAHTKSFQTWFRKGPQADGESRLKNSIRSIVNTQKNLQRQTVSPLENFNKSKDGFGELIQRHHSQDSQVLIRKNSLYMLNFLKRKQKAETAQSYQPHIGGIPHLASNMRVSQSTTKNYRYVPKVKNSKAKKQNKNAENFSKILSSLSIDPW